MSTKIVSIYSRKKTLKVKASTIIEASAIAGLMRKSGIKVCICQTSDNEYCFEVMAA